MRAGLLTELITFEEKRGVKTPFGSTEITYVPILTCKAYRKKLSAVLGKEVNASEEFIANTIVFQTRQYPAINENLRVSYKGNTYRIRLLDPQTDRTYLITCAKNND